MEKVNEIVLSIDNYDNVNQLFAEVAKILKMLMDNNYVCKVRDDERYCIVIEYEHDENRNSWGSPQLMWLTPDEVEEVWYNRQTSQK